MGKEEKVAGKVRANRIFHQLISQHTARLQLHLKYRPQDQKLRMNLGS